MENIENLIDKKWSKTVDAINLVFMDVSKDMNMLIKKTDKLEKKCRSNSGKLLCLAVIISVGAYKIKSKFDEIDAKIKEICDENEGCFEKVVTFLNESDAVCDENDDLK